jgi:hypothetical protein
MSWCVFLFSIAASSSCRAHASTSFTAGPRNLPSLSYPTYPTEKKTRYENDALHLRPPLQPAVAAQAQHPTKTYSSRISRLATLSA